MILAVLILGQGLLNAHAHNDYEHKRPLFEALEAGFTSVEADVFLVDGKLLVAHDRKNLKPERSLKSLYLEPLAKVAKSKGHILEGQEFTLMVDIKADGEAATRALIREIEPCRSYISTVIPRGIKVVVSGARSLEVIKRESFRLLSADGRPADLDLPADRDIAWVSDNWSNQFKWAGVGSFPEAGRQKLAELVRKAHQRNYRLRFWATPETPIVWDELRKAGVDLIGTDNLGQLSQFLRRR
ncbi:MAG: phosphatidylinositol-specific phospholipase C/glycerophosphodiester phosphodiesterase family protein [Fimbriimonadaceae bacterium]